MIGLLNKIEVENHKNKINTMSQYTTRIVEVRVSTSNGTSYKYENLVKRYKDTAKEGDYFVLYENYKPQTVKYVNGEFVRTNEKIPTVWKLVKFYSNYDVKNEIILDSNGEHPIFMPDGILNEEKVSSSVEWCNNGGYIRDNYISTNGCERQSFTGRGIPSDISEEAAKLMAPENDELFGCDCKHSRTWVTLSEWEELYNKKFEEFKRKISELYSIKNANSINKKLNIVLNKLGVETEESKNECYDEDETEQEEYVWDELYGELIGISDEISRNAALAEQFLDGSYVDYDNVRILYYIS